MSEESISPKQERKHDELDVYDMLVKQQHLILKQSEQLSKEIARKKEEEDEIDLRRLIPKFLRKKKTNADGQVVVSEEGGIAFPKINLTLPDLSKVKMPNMPDMPDMPNVDFARFRSIRFKPGFWGSVIGIFTVFYFATLRFSKVVITGTLLGALLGGYVFLTYQKVYESKMLIDAGTLPREFYFSLIEGLNKIAQNENKAELSRKLALSPMQAEKMVGVTAEHYEDYYIVTKEETDSTEMEADYPLISITVNVTDNLVLPYLEKSIFNYLSNNEYTNRERTIKGQMLQESVDLLNGELKMMDSLKTKVIERIGRSKSDDNYFVKETGLQTNGGLILSQQQQLEIEPMLPFNNSLNLFEKKARSYQSLLRLEKDFMMIDGFTAFDKPIFPRLRHVVFITAFFGFLSLLLATYLFVRNVRKASQEV